MKQITHTFLLFFIIIFPLLMGVISATSENVGGMIENQLTTSEEINHYFNMANQYYHNRQYDEARKIYQDLMNAKIIDARLYYNYANTCAQVVVSSERKNQVEGGLAEAIYYLELAHWLSPNNRDYIQNLRVLNNRVRSLEKDLGGSVRLENVFNWLQSYYLIFRWILICIIFFGSLFWFFKMVKENFFGELNRKGPVRFLSWTDKLSNKLLIFLLCVFIGIIGVEWIRNKVMDLSQYAIVRSESVALLVEPREYSESSVLLSEGHKVKIRSEYSGSEEENGYVGKYLNIITETGFTGWSPATNFILFSESDLDL